MVRCCCNPAHLFAGTYTDNNRDTSNKGRARGGLRKLTPLDIKDIFDLRAMGLSIIKIGQEKGVTKSNISYILRKKTWRYLTKNM